MEIMIDPRIENILEFNDLEPTMENGFIVSLLMPEEQDEESEAEYIPAENVSVENGKNADKNVNDTVYDSKPNELADDHLPSLAAHEDELTHSISVMANPDILKDIETVDVADLGCIMIDVEPLEVLKYIENGEDDLVTSTDAHDHTMGAVGETEAHVTLLFGLLENGNVIKDNVDAALDGWNTPDIKISEVDFFDTPDHNVIIAKVEKTPELVDGHERLTTLPNRQTFSEYTPHITLAYINKDVEPQKWIEPLAKVYNGKTVAAIGINYGDEPSEVAVSSNPKVLRQTINIEKQTHALLHAYNDDGHTHAIDQAMLDDINVLGLQKAVYAADQAYTDKYIKALEQGKPLPPPKDLDIVLKLIIAAIIIYILAKGFELLKPTMKKFDDELPRRPKITEADLRKLGTDIGKRVAKSHTQTIKHDLDSIKIKLAAGRPLKDIRSNEAELARFIPEMKRLVDERLTGRAKVVALNEATRVANKLSILAAKGYEKENKVKIRKKLVSSTGTPEEVCAAIIAKTAAKPIPLDQPYVKNAKYEPPMGGNIHVGCACYSAFVINGKIISSFAEHLHPRVLTGKRGGQFRRKLGINAFAEVNYSHASPTAFNKFTVPSLFTTKGTNDDEAAVNFFRERIRRGLPLPPIAVEEADDKLTIRDGYHRMRAFYLENKEPNIIITKRNESYSLTQDWIDQNQWWNIIPKGLLEKPTDEQFNSLADHLPGTDQQTVFNHLYSYLGYNTKPTVVSDTTFDKTPGTEWTTARGKTKYYDAFKNESEHYVSDLPTVYGPGTYFASNTDHADSYAGKDVNTVLAGKVSEDIPLLPADEGFDSQAYTDKRLKQLSLIALVTAANAQTQEDKDFYKARSEKLNQLRKINRLSFSSTLMGYPGIIVDNDTKNTTVADYLVINDRGSLLVREHDIEFRTPAKKQDTVYLTVAGGKKAEFPAKYYRMGRPPENGQSKNHATGELEDGTSVFKGYEDPTTGKITIDALHDANELTNGKKFYEVTGELLESTGSDHEVLLQPGTAKIVKEIDAAIVVTDNNPDYNLLGDDVSEEFETFPEVQS